MSLAPLDALVRDFTHVSLDTLDAFLARPGWSLLLVAGDATQRPEAQDLAVVAREVARRAPRGSQLGVVTESDEASVKLRFGLTAVPGLLFVRDGRTVSSIQRMQDWAVYQRAADTLWGRRPAEAIV
jgi:thioredoxin-like negative regulator of GroEL